MIDERFGVRGREGVDIEILGGTGGVNGGGFVYTNLDTVAVGVVLKLPKLAAQGTRPEEIIAGLKAHRAIAPLVEGGELKEYSAHLIPEGGWHMLPELATDGMLVAGDAAALCLAAGIWLEGVNFAMASGLYAGQIAADAVRRGDTTAAADERLPAAARDHVRAAGPPQAPPCSGAGAERPGPAPLPAARDGGRRADVHRRQPAAQARVAADPRGGAQACGRVAPRARPRRLGRIEDLRMNVTPTDELWPEISFPDRMETAHFDVHERPHIVVDGAKCADCSTRHCVVACPANLFVPTSDGGIVFNYEQCFECGTCYMVCNREGAISWSYPEGGYGVIFRRS